MSNVYLANRETRIISQRKNDKSVPLKNNPMKNRIKNILDSIDKPFPVKSH